MDLNDLTDSKLLMTTKKIVKEELQLTALIIDHLAEIERRKLYSDLKFRSLFDYCVRELGYSEDQAARRINALKLSRKVPMAKEKIDSGELSLTNANLISSFFNEVASNKSEQEKVVKLASKKSKRECQNILHELKREKGIADSPKRTVIKNESSDTVRLNISISKKTMEKIEKIRGIHGHQNLSLEKIIDLMTDALLEKNEEKLIPRRAGRSKGRSRYISKEVRKKALKNANGQCEICGSTYALEFDHYKKPFAFGGMSTSSNIRVLCKNCNLRSGIKIFGPTKMKRDLHAPARVTEKASEERLMGSNGICHIDL